ncbi:MAG TPA: amidohydrolase family protein [Bradyrhizobium sp.]|jgi:5-methylthioadenosine/S-adenosylhomocysteine deaminase|nr:amidohydrolase family protein [Bradyrhizobium sp.]
MCEICRRGFIGGAAALGATGLFSSPLMAQTPRGDSSSTRLPARGEFTIANAYVMTMERDFGDFTGGSVHVRDGEIVAVGHGVSGGEVIDGSGMIVMPGLVETHWHMWNTIFRSFAGDKPEDGYFPTVARFGQQMTPDDIFQSTRLSAAEAINSGITFVHSWCHNVRSTAHAEADIRALAGAGIRARHSCGWPQGLPDTQSADQAPIETLAKNWSSYSNEGLISLGMGWRGQFRAGPIKPEVYQPEFDNARRLGLPITVHVAAAAHRAVNQVELLYKSKLMGKDVQLVHALAVRPAELDMIEETGASISTSPGSELRIGYGFPLISEILAKRIPIGISIDTSALTGSSNMFGVLKLARDSENARAESEFKLTAQKALELGTIEGARAMGIEDKVGSLKPGKRADLIMISPNALNMAVVTDPAHLVLEATGPENVDTVVVDGRILKRGGKLVAVDTTEVIAGARTALAGIRERAKWR